MTSGAPAIHRVSHRVAPGLRVILLRDHSGCKMSPRNLKSSSHKVFSEQYGQNLRRRQPRQHPGVGPHSRRLQLRAGAGGGHRRAFTVRRAGRLHGESAVGSPARATEDVITRAWQANGTLRVSVLNSPVWITCRTFSVAWCVASWRHSCISLASSMDDNKNYSVGAEVTTRHSLLAELIRGQCICSAGGGGEQCRHLLCVAHDARRNRIDPLRASSQAEGPLPCATFPTSGLGSLCCASEFNQSEDSKGSVQCVAQGTSRSACSAQTCRS